MCVIYFIRITLTYFCLKSTTDCSCIYELPKATLKSSHPHLLTSSYFSIQVFFFFINEVNFTSIFHFSERNIRTFFSQYTDQERGQKANSNTGAV